MDFGNASTAGRWIIGAGQRIHWRNCFIWVYLATQVDTPFVKHDVCDGTAVVPVGVEVYIGGKDGLVKV